MRSTSRTRIIGVVIRKELTDHLRDRRTLIGAVLVPLIVFPLLFGVMGFLSNPGSNPSPVLLVNNDHSSLSSVLTDSLLSAPGLSVSQSGTANLTQSIQDGKYDIGLIVPSGFGSTLNSGGRINLTVYFDPSNGRALQALQTIDVAVTSLSQQIASQRLAAKNVTQADLNPVGTALLPVAKAESTATQFAAALFPSFLIMFSLLGGYSFIVDTTAGEKERRSLEALYTLPPGRGTIFAGKYLSACVLSVLTGLLGIVSATFSVQSFGGRGSVITLSLVGPILAVMVLAILLLVGVAFLSSIFAKGEKEAGQYLSPLFFAVFIPIYFVSFLPPSYISQFAAVPIIGLTILLRDVILARLTTFEVVSTLLSNLVTLALIFWIILKLMSNEKVVLRSSS